jgi:regulator of sigma E protease
MLLSIIVFVLVLSVLVLVHEFGHFIVAKKSGVWVEEFGIGLPPRLYGKKIGETIYSVNALPFGGFVRLHGEMVEDGVTKPKRAFLHKSKKVKFAVISAGVIMNFLLATVAFAFVYSFQGIPVLSETGSVKIIGVAPDSPAQKVGLTEGDIVERVNGEIVTTSDNFVETVKKSSGDAVRLDVVQSGQSETTSLSITPRTEFPDDQGPIGVVIASSEVIYDFPPIWKRPFVGIYYGFREAIAMGIAIVGGLWMIVKDLIVSGKVPTDVSGPVGIYAITDQAVQYGFFAVIKFMAFFSVNLAILNIFPFPGLDGGRLLFVIVESVTGKKVAPKIEAIVNTSGMLLLIVLLVLITVRDVRRLIEAGSIAGFIDSFLP